MRYIYVCSNCKKAFSNESVIPESEEPCPICGRILTYANITKQDWDQMSDQQKETIKNSYPVEDRQPGLEETHGASMVPHDPNPGNSMLSYLASMDQNLRVIKGILIFFAVLMVIGIIYAIVTIVQVSEAIKSLTDFFLEF